MRAHTPSRDRRHDGRRLARRIPALAAVSALAFLSLAATSSHTIRRGETLAQIAARYGTTVNALAQANGIANPNLIIAGHTLVIPSGSSASGSGAGTYVVERGDTLAAIARRHGTTVSALVSANQLRNPNFLLVGQTLSVPSGSSAAPATSSAAASSSAASYHVVKAGQGLAAIAHEHGVTIDQIVAANGITDGKIYAGQRLLLTARSGTPAAAPGGTYTVERGDTLAGIARRFGTSVSAIVDANGISNPNAIRIGKVLQIPAGGTAGGTVLCPVPGGSFMNDFGFPRSGGRFHEGNDVFAPRGTPVLAPVSGVVQQLTGKLGGNQVKLMGDDGVGYYGTHMDKFGKSGRVQAGEVIGYVGNTGNAIGGPTHLHFEVHPGGGAAVNPYPILSRAC
ncbi:MAG: LysM peptidoglycan-binding domain-containing protein [Acidimicrobiia bacterium]